MSKDYYKSLGVDKNASKEEIKKAFRTLAHKYHPDKGGDAEKFKEINEAYSVLSDENKKAQYDQYGSNGPQGGFGGGQGGFGGGFDGFDFSGFSQGGGASFDFDLGDILGGVFGGGGRQKKPRGADISVDTQLTFEESVFGVEKKITLNKTSVCEHCKGTGAEKGSELSTCTTCAGNGKVRQVKQTMFGQFESVVTCDTCHGSGKIPKTKCSVCKGSGVYKKQTELSVKIPGGIEDGEMVRLSGGGEAISGGTTGDLYIKIRVKKHPLFYKEGPNLRHTLHIKLTDALLGTTHRVETLDGTIDVKIPEGITHGEILKIKGKGVPYDSSKRGDILLTIHIDIPHKLSKDARKKIEELKALGM
jgi:molecular chaperone DnaJ